MRRQHPVKIVLYCPKTADSRLELSKRVAAIHADAVLARLKTLHCPEAQKQALLDAIIATARTNVSHESSSPDNLQE